jgi:hypothetical protein
VLVADDLPLRVVASETHGVRSVSTQDVLRHLHDKGRLSADRYAAAIVQLARWGYRYLALRAEDIMRVVDAHPGNASGAVAPLLRSLHGPECTLESALAVGADALYQLWTSANSRNACCNRC